MADLSVMGFLNEETQQEAEYNLKDAAARQSISALQNSVGSLGDSVDAIEAKIPDNASSSNKLATISDVSAAYKPKGNATLATLPQLVIANLNTVYNMTEDFVTTSDFAEGAGVSVEAGNEVGIINIAPEGSGAVNLKYTVLGGFIDTSGFYNTSETLETDVDGQDKFPFYDFSAGAKRQVTFGSIKAKLKEYFDLFYTNLVSSATNGNFASLDANGNLVDSGKKASDFATTGNVIANTKLIKDTVGWSKKNQLPTKNVTGSSSGISQQNNADGSITISGTATATKFINLAHSLYDTNFKLEAGKKYILSGCPSGGNADTYKLDIRSQIGETATIIAEDTGNGVMFTMPTIPSGNDNYYQVIIRIQSGYAIQGSLVFYPMIRPADILDDTYEPYFGSTAFPRSEQAVLGAKNVLKNDGAPSQSRANTSWTKNTNGSVTVSTTGSASGDSDYHLNNPTSRPISEIKNGMIMTAVEHAGDSYDAFNSKFYLCIIYRNSSDGYISQQSCVDGPVTLNIPDNAAYYRMSVAVYTGAEIDNVTVYPMISFDGGDYVPNAMTNKELTENKVDKARSSAVTTLSSIFSSYAKISSAYLVENDILVNLRVESTAECASGVWTNIGTLLDKYKPAALQYLVAIDNSNNNPFGIVRIQANGSIDVFHSTGSNKEAVFTILYMKDEV